VSHPTLFGEPGGDAARPVPVKPAAKTRYRPLPEVLCEPPTAGASVPEREAVARAVLDTLSDAAAGKADDDEVYRALKGALYVLTADETERLAGVFLELLGRAV